MTSKREIRQINVTLPHTPLVARGASEEVTVGGGGGGDHKFPMMISRATEQG